MPRKRKVPPASDIPTGLCECGCDTKTKIAKCSDNRRRQYIGYPCRFVQGHSKPSKGSAHHLWKGGKYIRRGYVIQYAPEHPKADCKGYVPEHRLVMEKVIGRPLESWEQVHHINEVRDDNRPENLEIVTASTHSTMHNKAAHMRKFVTKEKLTAWGKLGSDARWNKK